MDAKQHEYPLEQWSILIQERLNNGQSVRPERERDDAAPLS